jgi:Na+-translocating ferredoxin:NAD+ oxidoreductase subunit B
MGVVKLLAAFLLALLGTCGISFLSYAWKSRVKPDQRSARLAALLPGFDCGLCGRIDCRGYVEAVLNEAADPALCAPGGAALESQLRALLGEEAGDERSRKKRAAVLCAGADGIAGSAFAYDGHADCVSAAVMYGGPKRCKDGCVGLGSCAKVCPVRAIRVDRGLARVDRERCTGCGRCAAICPTGVIALVEEDQVWIVACASDRDSAAKKEDCAVCCTACGECVRRSFRGEFAMKGSLAVARANPDGFFGDIAPHCPTGAIVDARGKKSRRSSLRKVER